MINREGYAKIDCFIASCDFIFDCPIESFLAL